MIAEVDDDGSGEIDFEEFKLMMKKQINGTKITNRKSIEIVFKVLSLKDGGIDLATFQHALHQIGLEVDNEEVKSMFSVINTSGNGIITQRELKKFLKSKL